MELYSFLFSKIDVDINKFADRFSHCKEGYCRFIPTVPTVKSMGAGYIG